MNTPNNQTQKEPKPAGYINVVATVKVDPAFTCCLKSTTNRNIANKVETPRSVKRQYFMDSEPSRNSEVSDIVIDQ